MNGLEAILLSQAILWIGVFVVILRLHQKNASLKRDIDSLKRDLEGGR